MSGCGCGESHADTDTRHGVRLNVIHENAAMCCMCVHAEHDGSFWSRGPERCGITGRDALDMAARGVCPRRKYPEGDRRVTRWALMRWYGVPYPVRLVVWIVGANHRPPSAWRECGCIVWAKDLWRLVRTAIASHPTERA